MPFHPCWVLPGIIALLAERAAAPEWLGWGTITGQQVNLWDGLCRKLIPGGLERNYGAWIKALELGSVSFPIRGAKRKWSQAIWAVESAVRAQHWLCFFILVDNRLEISLRPHSCLYPSASWFQVSPLPSEKP